MNFKLVMDWVRRHVFIVVFGAIIIAAPITGWLIGGSLKGGVVSALNSKKSDLEALSGLEQTTVTLNVPGREAITTKTIVNRQVIDAYGQVIEALRKDADTVRTAALAHNSKNRDVLSTEVFPKPRPERRADAHERLYPLVAEAYEKLLSEVRAGQPPPASEVREQLQRRAAGFIASLGGKRTRSDLAAEDQQRLDEDLVRARKSIYADRARSISFYASPASIGMPQPPRNVPSAGVPLDRMFEWNWNFWIVEDVVRGLAAANEGTPNVLEAPFKRIIQLRVEPLPRGAGTGSAAAPEGEPAADAGGGGQPIDPKPEIAKDFSQSFTGRHSNPLYDVRTVQLQMVAETEALPRVFDALAKQNFITITDAAIKPANPFAAARLGFLYGPKPVSEVSLVLEIIQLREWTTLRMPSEMKARIGTQGILEQAPGSGVGDSVGGA